MSHRRTDWGYDFLKKSALQKHLRKWKKKKKASDWKAIFVQHISNKGLETRICKEFSQQ